ncbi:Aste57867_14973 [Aphanomyces stellatus]|uniref:Aste57867_14973 protein n=1 Tax=Aphanomyces stellatus TaxID=120398 RepID=A0A485L4Q7_9STRA|nr:hypothetical protein As57867_014917 [Aphanomyces stellatus]VFT91787.1 Aste57867_14973 [Aphanomyces stellatus]
MGYLTVRIQLHKATDLPAADISLLGGKSDPYVIFSLGVHQARSTCINASLNPEWNAANFEFQIDSARYTTAALDVNVWDNDVWRKDDLLGKLSIPLTDMSHNQVTPREYALDVEPAFESQNVQPKLHMTVQLLNENEAADRLFLEVWENERFGVLNRKWASENLKASERKRWSSESGRVSADKFDDAVPPVASSYKATESWHYVKTSGDLNGWVYAPDFDGPWFEKTQARFYVRRRRWVQELALESSSF